MQPWVVLSYAVGGLLLIAGILRAVMLGRYQPEREVDEEAADRRVRKARYHLRWGVIWVIMGLGLIISTIYQTQR